MSQTPSPPTATVPHETLTSTGTGDVKTFAGPPEYATGCLMCAKTNAARVTFDGSAPVVGSNGLVLPAGGLWQPVPFAKKPKFVSEIAGNSEVSVLWLS